MATPEELQAAADAAAAAAGSSSPPVAPPAAPPQMIAMTADQLQAILFPMQQQLAQNAEFMQKQNLQIVEQKKNHDEQMKQMETDAQTKFELQQNQHEESLRKMEENQSQQLDKIQENSKENSTPKSTKITVISKKEDVKNWLYVLDGELLRLGIANIVELQRKNFEISDTSQHHQVTISDKEKKLLDAVASDLRWALRDDALTICRGYERKTASEIIHELVKWGGTISDVAATSKLSDFTTGKWNPNKESLKVWIAGKFSLCCELKDSIHPSTHEVQMRFAILNNLPPNFAGKANELRTKPPAKWQDIETALTDFDDANQESDGEVAGKVNLAVGKKQKGGSSSSSSSGTPGTSSPSSLATPAPVVNNYYIFKGGKGKGKGKGKFGKQKGKFQGNWWDNKSTVKKTGEKEQENPKVWKFPCRKCHQLGHWAKECPNK
jgi:hypothetical protein